MLKNEFTVFGYEMEKVTVAFGFFLVFWGVAVSMIAQSDSITSYIPSILGLPLILFGYLTLKIPSRKKLFMHLVVLFGLIIFLGGLDVIRSYPGIFSNFWADLSKLMLAVTGFIYTYLNIKSFIYARKAS
jgi:hypothetical protein|tara:strand:+ start:389 stop:778 length:390 start_codon:yes stop_codon:yes gene_type:complete